MGDLALHVGEGRLLAVNVARGNKFFKSRHGVLYNREMTAILHYPCFKRRKEYAIPAQVWHITDDVFEGCTSLHRIVLRSRVIESLDWIPEGAELINQFED